MEVAVRSAYGITVAEFERRWHRATMRRYGALAIATDVTLAGLAVTAVVLPLYVARRRRDRARLARLVAADEATERRQRESALEELLRSADE